MKEASRKLLEKAQESIKASAILMRSETNLKIESTKVVLSVQLEPCRYGRKDSLGD